MIRLASFLIGALLTALFVAILSGDASLALLSVVEFAAIFLLTSLFITVLRRFDLVKFEAHPAIISGAAFLAVTYITWSLGVSG